MVGIQPGHDVAVQPLAGHVIHSRTSPIQNRDTAEARFCLSERRAVRPKTLRQAEWSRLKGRLTLSSRRGIPIRQPHLDRLVLQGILECLQALGDGHPAREPV